jgi:hypothetical protein
LTEEDILSGAIFLPLTSNAGGHFYADDKTMATEPFLI